MKRIVLILSAWVFAGASFADAPPNHPEIYNFQFTGGFAYNTDEDQEVLGSFEFRAFDKLTFGPVFGFGQNGALVTNKVPSTSFTGSETNNMFVFIGANWYSRRTFEGLWLHLASGYEQFRTGKTFFRGNIIVSDIPLIASIGWRWVGKFGITTGISTGFKGFWFGDQTKTAFTANIQIGLAFDEFPH